jgi:RHS repeat-associated protein
VVSDAKLPAARVLSFTDYYAFGGAMPGRSGGAGYRYGFNNQEQDPETRTVHFKFREHDPRIGRFWSVDPLAASYPWNSPYAFAENRVIDGIDLEGLEYVSANNTGLSPEALRNMRNTDGTYNLDLGRLSFNNVEIVNYNGQQYFNLGQDVYYGDNGWSVTGSNNQRMSEWVYSNISPTIPESQFVGWEDEVNNKTCSDCFICCTMQLDQIGLTSSGVGRRVQIYERDDVIADGETFYQGISYIHRALEAGDAIRVGVDYNGNSKINVDRLTDHFVTIVGRGRDNHGEYFRFYENAVGSGGDFGQTGRLGVSTDNKLYVNANGTITGTSVWNNTFFRVTMIRPNTNQPASR